MKTYEKDCYVHSNGDEMQYRKSRDAYVRDMAEFGRRHLPRNGGEPLLNAADLLEMPEEPERVIVDAGGLRIYSKRGGLAWDVGWDRIDTPERLLGEIRCICGKTWCDSDVVRGVINAYDERHGTVEPYMD